MKEKLQGILQAAKEQLSAAADARALDEARVKFLGKKGELTALLKGMKDVAAEERPVVGQLINDVRAEIETIIEKQKQVIEQAALAHKLESETIDVTLPGEEVVVGKEHPLNIVLDELKEIFIGLGFSIAEGPEVELDHYNFEALNIPKDHPARDTQDTFYISDNVVLRTQTSGMQVRVMEKKKPPIRIIAPGRVYRSDAVDATHSPLFHQIEGLVVDKGIRMSDLKGISSCSPKSCMARIRSSASARTTSRSPSRVRKWTSSATAATARAARSARARAGSRSSAAAWCTPRCSRPAASIRRNTRAMRSASVWSARSWAGSRSTTSACSMRTT